MNMAKNENPLGSTRAHVVRKHEAVSNNRKNDDSFIRPYGRTEEEKQALIDEKLLILEKDRACTNF
jgi:hypothetical protein